MKKKSQEASEEILQNLSGHLPGPDQAEGEDETPVTVTLPQEAKEPLTSQAPEADRPQQGQDVQVAPHLSDLLTGIEIPLEEEERAREQSNLDQAIHKLLIVGLIISVALILFGLFLDLILRRVIPTSLPHPGEVFTRVISMRPSGFLSLGLLVLIITPVVRVIGSFIAFVYERDWRFAGITFLVLLIVALSIVLGRG